MSRKYKDNTMGLLILLMLFFSALLAFQKDLGVEDLAKTFIIDPQIEAISIN